VRKINSAVRHRSETSAATATRMQNAGSHRNATTHRNVLTSRQSRCVREATASTNVNTYRQPVSTSQRSCRPRQRYQPNELHARQNNTGTSNVTSENVAVHVIMWSHEQPRQRRQRLRHGQPRPHRRNVPNAPSRNAQRQKRTTCNSRVRDTRPTRTPLTARRHQTSPQQPPPPITHEYCHNR